MRHFVIGAMVVFSVGLAMYWVGKAAQALLSFEGLFEPTMPATLQFMFLGFFAFAALFIAIALVWGAVLFLVSLGENVSKAWK